METIAPPPVSLETYAGQLSEWAQTLHIREISVARREQNCAQWEQHLARMSVHETSRSRVLPPPAQAVAMAVPEAAATTAPAAPEPVATAATTSTKYVHYTQMSRGRGGGGRGRGRGGNEGSRQPRTQAQGDTVLAAAPTQSEQPSVKTYASAAKNIYSALSECNENV
jgi:hypothetical protein